MLASRSRWGRSRQSWIEPAWIIEHGHEIVAAVVMAALIWRALA